MYTQEMAPGYVTSDTCRLECNDMWETNCIIWVVSMIKGRCDDLWIQHTGWKNSALNFWPNVRLEYMPAFLKEVTDDYTID